MDIINSFEQSVGKVWKALNSKGPLTENKLIWGTKLENNMFYSAVGWLARENKICKEGDIYKLGETNLTSKIGKDAGKVWRVLDTWGEVDVISISRLARIEEENASSAIGWLAREGKIEGRAINAKENKIKFWLK
ncbi:MAG: winged helix-turn-helix domain-containing protein [Thermoplasmatales archaeon]|nr:MAG: winged helix-turn-helix domain-containing protein [Thermoplasmatales archaeon]